jgi:FMN-dependent NADH-azoreductase
MTTTTAILEVSASARRDTSVSRMLSADLIDALKARHGDVTHARRDLADGIPFVDEAWVEANFTPEETRSDAHRASLALSDELVEELARADVLVIGTPIYNFSIPAALKAWIDMIARARKTFRYTESGPRGLLEGKKAYLVVATGGVPVGSPVDFATPYLKHALKFIGITDVEIVAADQLNSNAEESIDNARARIAELVHLEKEVA